jgi:hypothetical protein
MLPRGCAQAVPYDFCTLLDHRYLARGVVLARSLAEHAPGSRLQVFCMDAEARRLLDRLDLPGVVAIGLDELEAADPDLAAVKPGRTQVEYCWTATPSVCLHALAREPGLREITYLDADLMLFGDPKPIFDELGDASILLTPHRHVEGREVLEGQWGIYNVQFMTFRRDERGIAALSWWRERCLEWCYARIEEGRWGDQKYLDDWPERFAGVHVLGYPGALGPWNAAGHRIEPGEGRVLVDGVPLVFFHFAALGLYGGLASLRRLGLFSHSLRLVRRPLPLVWHQRYSISGAALELVWEPYVGRLGQAMLDLRHAAPGFAAGIERVGPREALEWVARRGLGRPLPQRRWGPSAAP